MAIPDGQDLREIRSLEREIENAEGNDQQLHKLFNNLGVACTTARLFNKALEAHREEKQACARLRRKDPYNVGLFVNMAIAYRKCGDATMRVKKLGLKQDQTVTDKRHILSIANTQHVRGLETAKEALSINKNHHGALVEVQAATASVGFSAVELGIETKSVKTLQLGANVTKAAAFLAGKLPPGCVTAKKRDSMFVNAANNCALAFNALEDYDKAINMFTAVAVYSKKCGDDENYIRAVANLVELLVKKTDFTTAKKYALIWAEKANFLNNEHEEATACMSLSSVLTQLFEYEQARKALQEAMFLFKDNKQKTEASNALRLVEENIEADKRDEAKLLNLESKLIEMKTKHEDDDDYDAVKETLMRREAGDIAYLLRRYETCIEHLERFMHLMKTKAHICAPDKIGLQPGHVGKTVANLADACWRCGHVKKAVDWGWEELFAYGDEIAGQAQAWNNLGNYLCDYGFVEDGIKGLEKSIELAIEAGEVGIEETARNNLDIEKEKRNKKRNDAQPATRNDGEVIIIPDDVPATRLKTTNATQGNNTRKRRRETGTIVNSDRRMEEILPRFSNTLREAQVEMDGRSPPVGGNNNSILRKDEQNSIVICSNPDAANGIDIIRGEISRGGMGGNTAASSGAFSVSRPQLAGVTTLTTTDGPISKSVKSGAISSVATGGRYKDVADAYKRLCRSKRNGRGIKARDGLLDILRKIAAKAMFEEEEIEADFSGTFIQDHELGLLSKAVGSLDHPHGVKLNLARNPLLSHVGYSNFLTSNSNNNICELDLSGSGLHPKVLLQVAEAVEDASLGNLVKLCASKNSLGKYIEAAAKAVTKLLAASKSGTGKLEELDLSMNRFPGTFLRRLVELLGQEHGAGNGGSLKKLDLRLNHTRNPTALLEVEEMADLSDWMKKLAAHLPDLCYIDVRACGASTEVRNILYKVSKQELAQVHIAGATPYRR